MKPPKFCAGCGKATKIFTIATNTVTGNAYYECDICGYVWKKALK